MSADQQTRFCGCCGRPICQGTTDWCMDCLSAHVDTLAERPEEATFFARYGMDCPFTEQENRRNADNTHSVN